MIRKILIVCAGNVCRSPMAEAALRQAFDRTNFGLASETDVKSCGLKALIGQPAVESAIVLMREREADITGHRAKQIDAKLVIWADLVLVMEKSHRDIIQSQLPSSRGKVFRLGHFSDSDIPDPYRQSSEKFVEALHIIESGVSDWVQEISRSEAANS